MKKVLKWFGIFIVGFLVFFIGRQTGHGYPVPTVVTKEVPGKTIVQTITKNVPVTTTIPADTTEWKALKNADDQGFITESKVFGLLPQIATTCSDAIQATANGDTGAQYNDADTMKSLSAQVNSLNGQLNTEADKRNSILKQLGY